MIKLHQFAPAFGLPNASPFCMKLETWLRMAGLPYESVEDGNVIKAPKGKMPYIVDDDGTTVADSTLVIEHLTRRRGVALDAWLTPAQRAQALAMQRLIEEHLYWVTLYLRWMTPEGWPKVRQAFFGTLPTPLKQIVPPLARRGMKAELHGHGMGRHSMEQIVAFGCQDVEAIADFLGDQPFMMGAQPSTLDAVAHAFLANLLWAPFDTPVQGHARTRPTLEAYCQRMRARYWPG